MTNASIQPFAPGSGALSVEHYQTFEMAKENDDVLGGDNIAQIRSYAAYARAQAQAIHKTIAATSGIDDVAAIKAEAVETEQTFAKVGIYADQRIGELLRELPKAVNQHNEQVVGIPTSTRQAEREAGIEHHTSIDLQAMAANPDVVQAVLDRAEAEGRIPSRKQVLDAIKDRDMARKVGETLKHERDVARADLQDAYREIEVLEKQNDSLYAQANASKEPKVVERQVVPKDYEDAKRRVHELEHLERVHSDDNQKLRKQLNEARKELDKAKSILGMNKNMQDVRRDVQYLVTATNAYVRQYGGLTWTAQSLASVDEPTLEELTKAIRNLATFSNALMTCLEDFNGNR